MKKILIATTNKDKFKVVTYLLDRAGLSKSEYVYQSLDDINYDGPDKKEQGSIAKRAEDKAKVVKEYLKEADFEYIIGIDDGIFIKSKLQENIKEYIGKILYENYLSEGEQYAFYRAYCVIDRSGNEYKTEIDIPYVYKPKENAVLKANSYPLSQVSVPIGHNKALTDLDENEGNEYVWSYSKAELKKLIYEISQKKNKK